MPQQQQAEMQQAQQLAQGGAQQQQRQQGGAKWSDVWEQHEAAHTNISRSAKLPHPKKICFFFNSPCGCRKAEECDREHIDVSLSGASHCCS